MAYNFLQTAPTSSVAPCHSTHSTSIFAKTRCLRTIMEDSRWFNTAGNLSDVYSYLALHNQRAGPWRTKLADILNVKYYTSSLIFL